MPIDEVDELVIYSKDDCVGDWKVVPFGVDSDKIYC